MTIEESIRRHIEARIASGEWRPGHRIPFEHELVAEFGCARATVGKALAALTRAGLIERRRKAGSFVARPHVQSAVLAIPDIPAMVEASGKAYRFELRALRIAPAADGPPELALLGGKGNALHLEGLHLADDAPFAFERRAILLDTVPEAAAVDFVGESPGSWLLHQIPWTDAQHRITAVNADRALSRALDISPGLACLSVERWTWRAGRGVTFVRQLFPGDRYDLTAVFTPS